MSVQKSKLRPGMFSMRFDHRDAAKQFRRVFQILKRNDFPVRLVNPDVGDDFAMEVFKHLDEIRREEGVLLAVCTEDYGERTGVNCDTFNELRISYSQHVKIVPLRMSDVYPPQPKDEKSRALVNAVFLDNVAYEDCRGKSDDELAGLMMKLLVRPP